MRSFSLLLLLALTSCEDKKPPSGGFSQAQLTGTLKSDFLEEASGLAASRQYPGVLWSHNDSGHGPSLFAIDTTGALIRRYELAGASNTDWEDICLGWDERDQRHYLYIGDIGDNFSRRRVKRIYRVEEPNPTNDSIRELPVSIITFSPQGGPQDMEALMYDSSTGGLLLISKRESQVGIYQLPSIPSSDTVTADRAASLPLSGIVAGDISADGSEILLKTITNIYYWQRRSGETTITTLQRPPVVLNYTEEPQGESITWSTDAYYTLSEKAGPSTQKIYRYARIQSSAIPPQQ